MPGRLCVELGKLRHVTWVDVLERWEQLSENSFELTHFGVETQIAFRVNSVQTLDRS